MISHFTFSSIFFRRSLYKIHLWNTFLRIVHLKAYIGIFLRSPQLISPSSLVNQTSKSFSTPSKKEAVLTVVGGGAGGICKAVSVVSLRMPKEQWSNFVISHSFGKTGFENGKNKNHQILGNHSFVTNSIYLYSKFQKYSYSVFLVDWTCIFSWLDENCFLAFTL